MAETIDTNREDWHKSLTPVSRHLGMVIGKLQVAERGGKLKLTVLEQNSGDAIPCELPQDAEWQELAHRMQGKKVAVMGCLNFYDWHLRWMTHLEAIREAKSKPMPTPMKGSDFMGAIPDPYAAKDPVAFLRKIRGYDDDWD